MHPIPVFELLDQQAVLNHLNIRQEFRGEEKVLAVDLSLQYTADNGELAQFASDLKHSLYCVPDPHQGKLDGVKPEPTMLRFPSLGVLDWKLELKPYILVAKPEVAPGTDVLQLHRCSLNKFKIDAKEGGSVVITFRAQAEIEKQSDIQRLSAMLLEKISLSCSFQEEKEASPQQALV